jgi:polyisoprenoid-binding protein YceI
MATSAPTTAGVTTWNIDPAHTLVEFSAKHMMITTVKGRIADVKGTITIDEGDLDRSSAEVEFVAASLDTRAEQRDAHQRSADFLDVETHPPIHFRSTRVEGARMEAGAEFVVYGELTIRGVSREVKIAATFEGTGKDPWGGTRASFSGDTKIDRRDFGLTWNAALETGGVLVSNDIKIHLEVQAVRA